MRASIAERNFRMLTAPDDLIQLLTHEGKRVTHADFSLDITDDEIRSLYRDLCMVRRFDNEATALQRQGELALWAQCQGQEAAQVGAGRALLPTDFVFPSYREHGIAWTSGVDPVAILGLFRGTTNGGWDPYEHNFGLYTVVIGNQCLHAVGYAMAGLREGKTEAVLTCFGDGGSNQGDVSEAFVFAGVYNAPVVFLCQNNQYAISEPNYRQMRAPIYKRAEGYGFPGYRVDGNDVLAMLAVMRHSYEHARSGKGPVLVEAFTYRLGAHTTSDDPTRYRDADEVEYWKDRDPLLRVKRYLDSVNTPQSFYDEIEVAAEAMAVHIRAGVRELADPTLDEMFTHVYAEPHPLVEQEHREMTEYFEQFGGMRSPHAAGGH
ncbi:MAG: pyruvate dehydrogenase (acetyl-transferring) E1 component subunit alpha [Actinobacteria bacterium]|jgi:pyruvate dehydrogenase E1 component alpha subunit|nr:pyruvate dehydrogenase (acetyl-transferring) E1 component subunit alpha [Actinomycetota bacterium]